MNKKALVKFFAVAVSTLLVACGGDTGSSTAGPGDGVEGQPASSTRVERASLEAAVPANGQLVRGDFLLGAVVDSPDLVEVRFLVDGVEVGAVNDLPYQLDMSACDLSAGNHAYIVTIEDANGHSDYVEQFFETAPCE